MNNKNYKYIHEKVNMADVIPLDTPFTVVIEPTNTCNFKCAFCFHALGNDELKEKNYKSHTLSFSNYKKIIDDLSKFSRKIKVIRFSGLGEPTINQDLDKMIYYAKEKGVSERVMLITNGSLLTNELSDRLIKSGLDELFISIEGLTTKRYKELCLVDLDFSKLVSNIEYFYKNKGNISLHARLLKDEEIENQSEDFYNIFNKITDNAFIENVIPVFEGVNYENMKVNIDKDIEGKPKKELDVCIQPFNSMFIHASGNVSPCCTDYRETINMGNIFLESALDIWNGKKYKEFQVMHLKKMRKSHTECSKCDFINYVNQKENNIDISTSQILKKYL